MAGSAHRPLPLWVRECGDQQGLPALWAAAWCQTPTRIRKGITWLDCSPGDGWRWCRVQLMGRRNRQSQPPITFTGQDPQAQPDLLHEYSSPVSLSLMNLGLCHTVSIQWRIGVNVMLFTTSTDFNKAFFQAGKESCIRSVAGLLSPRSPKTFSQIYNSHFKLKPFIMLLMIRSIAHAISLPGFSLSGDQPILLCY